MIGGLALIDDRHARWHTRFRVLGWWLLALVWVLLAVMMAT